MYIGRSMAAEAHLPSWGEPLDSDIAASVETLGILVVGYLHWTSETPRYFGPGYEEVKPSCVVRFGALENKKSWYKSFQFVIGASIISVVIIGCALARYHANS